MAIVLKSNVVATKSLGHISGIVGPIDYSGVIDFVNRKMIEDNIEKDIFSANSLEVSNISAAHYLSIYDPISNTFTKKLNQNNLATHLDYLGEKGLVAYAYTSNWMSDADADGYLTATKTRTIGSSGVNKLVTLQVFGTGSVTLSGGVSSQGEGLTATYEKPITVLTTGTTITATVSGNVLHYQLLPKNKIYKNVAIVYTGQSTGVYFKPRSAPLTKCSFLFHANLSSFETFNYSAYQLLFALKANTSDFLVALVKNNQIRFAFVSTRDTPNVALKPIQIGAVVVAVTLDNNRLKVFFDGEKVFDFTATANIGFTTIDLIRSGGTESAGLNGTIKKLFTYSRAVSDAEAIQMTNSFKF